MAGLSARSACRGSRPIDQLVRQEVFARNTCQKKERQKYKTEGGQQRAGRTGIERKTATQKKPAGSELERRRRLGRKLAPPRGQLLTSSRRPREQDFWFPNLGIFRSSMGIPSAAPVHLRRCFCCQDNAISGLQVFRGSKALGFFLERQVGKCVQEAESDPSQGFWLRNGSSVADHTSISCSHVILNVSCS